MSDPTVTTPREPSAVVDENNPWPGLASFREADEAFFKGREQEIEDLRRIVQSQRVTVLFGASGLGKTSLLRAGLFPELRRRNEFPVYVRLDFADRPPVTSERMQPDADATARSVLSEQVLADTFAQAAARGVDVPPRNEREPLWEYLHRRDVAFFDERNRLVTPVLILDQFEEVFSRGLENPEWAPFVRAFFDELSDLAEGRPPESLQDRVAKDADVSRQYDFASHRYRVVLSLREDYLAPLEELRARMPSIGAGRYRLQPMGGEQALTVVDQTKGRLVETSIARKIVRFSAGRDIDEEKPALAALQVDPSLLGLFCRELNERRQNAGAPRITEELVRSSEGNIVEGFYEECMRLAPPALRRFVEDELVTAHGHRDSRALEDALLDPSVTRDDVTRLVDARLLRTEDRGGTRRIELTHDVLTRVVRAARDRRNAQDRVEQEQAAERERLRLEKDIAERARLEREAELNRVRAEQAERDRKQSAELARLAEHGRDEQARSVRRFRWLSICLGLALIAALGAAFWAVQESKRATNEAHDAEHARDIATTEKKNTLAALQDTVRVAEDLKQAAKYAIKAPDPESQREATALYNKAETVINSAQQDIQKLETCSVAPRLYLHIKSESERGAADKLIPALKAQGFVVPGIERVDNVPRTTEVRYFNKLEDKGANVVAEALRRANVQNATAKFVGGYEKSSGIRPCHYEVWFADGSLPTP